MSEADKAMTEALDLGKLLPCPFCGGEATAIARGGAFGVRCVTQHFVCVYGATAEHAAAAWNTRAPEDHLLSRLREVEEIVEVVLACDREALADHRPKWGPADCVDNTGKPYQSKYLGDALDKARALSASLPIGGDRE